MKVAAALEFILFTIFLTPLNGQDLSHSQWSEDIDFLQHAIISIHPDPFHDSSNLNRLKLDNSCDSLKRRLVQYNANQIITEITKIVGMLNDGHSSVDIFSSREKAYRFKYFPVWMYYFEDGLYLINAPEEYTHALGSKLIAINNTGIKELYNKFSLLIPKDKGNEYSFKDGLRFYLFTAEYLNGLGIINGLDTAVYHFEDHNSRKTSVSVHSGSISELFASLGNARSESLPLYRTNEGRNYWYKHLNNENALYIRYVSQQSDPSLPFPQFCDQLQRALDSTNSDKIILDLRQGQGGNIATMGPIYRFLSQPKVNQKGKLYVLMDRRTQSASSILALRLSMITKAIFIGEPSLSSPNLFDNPKTIILPNSKLKIDISTHYEIGGFPNDKRPSLEADIFMQVTAQDFFSKKDPVLDFALRYRHKMENKGLFQSGNDLTGMYEYSLIKTLHIEKENDKWRMFIEGDLQAGFFLNTEIYHESNDRYNTDIRGVRLSILKSYLVLHTPWGDMKLNKLPNDYESPEQLLQSGAIDKCISLIKGLYSRGKVSEKRDFEGIINTWGYQLISRNAIIGAIQLFSLNTELFPSSANTWDSLGEAYAKIGNKQSAILNYEKALKLNPQSLSARNALNQLNQY